MEKEKDVSLFKRLNQLFKNDTRLRRKIKSRDTSLVVPDKTTSNGLLLFQKATTPSATTITSNAYNLSERLMRYQDFCFGKNTPIKTQKGTFKISELAKMYKPGQRFIVYSYDYELKQQVSAIAHSPRLVDNGTQKERVRITLTTGHLELTPDHRVLLLNGTVKEAKDLIPGDFLMTFVSDDVRTYFIKKEIYTFTSIVDFCMFSGDIHRLMFGDLTKGLEVDSKEIKHIFKQNGFVNWQDFQKRFVDAQIHATHLTTISESEKPLPEMLIKLARVSNSLDELAARLACTRHVALESIIEHGFVGWDQLKERLNKHNKQQKKQDSFSYSEILAKYSKGMSLNDLAIACNTTIDVIRRCLKNSGFDTFHKWEHNNELNRVISVEKINDDVVYNITVQKHHNLAVGVTVNKSNVYKQKRQFVFCTQCEQEYTPELSCITLDSIIFTPNGEFTLGDLLAEQEKQHKLEKVFFFDVYAYDEDTHKLSIGIAHSIRKTKSAQQIFEITFDSGRRIRCTEEHLFLTKQSGWLPANKLRINDWLQPFGYKIIDIKTTNVQEDVYDLTVEKYHNFISCGVVVHNCALDIFSEEVCASDAQGRIVHIYSENEKIKEVLSDLMYNILNIEFNLKPWVRNLCKFGDHFNFIDVSPEYGIMNVFPIPVNEIEREENFDRDDPFAVRFRWVSLANRILQNWEVMHMRLMSNDAFLPYGTSVLEPTRRIWRQLILAEDSMLTYRVVRAPERRVFYIDVGNLPPEEIDNYVEQQKRRLHSNQIIDQSDGRVDKRYNAMNIEEDFYIPVRGEGSLTKIDTLPGGQNASAVDDVKYLQQKMLSGLKMPISWLGFTENLSSKATLSQLDVRFSRTTTAIQKVIISELSKLAVIHLFAHGFTNDDLINFSIKLTNPSSIAEQQKLQLWRDRFEIVDAAPKDLLSERWISKNILNLSDFDIKEIKKEKKFESGTGDEEGGFGGSPSGGSFGKNVFGKDEEGGDELGDIIGKQGEEELNAASPGESGEEEEIVAGVDHLEDSDDELILSNNKKSTEKFPIKPQSKAIYKSKQRQYVRHAKSGRADIGMSNNDEITIADDIDTVIDADFFRDITKNTFTKADHLESIERHQTLLANSPDMTALFKRMREHGYNKSSNNNLLSEAVEFNEKQDVQNEIDDVTVEIDLEGFETQ